MKTKIEQFPATNPVLSVGKDGTVLYSNVASKPLLHEWGVRVGEKLPSCIGDFVQRVICRNSPEKMEVKVGKRVYLVTFYPSPKQEYVNIFGLYIMTRKSAESSVSEEKYRAIFKNSIDAILLTSPDGAILEVNPSCLQDVQDD